MMSRPFHRQQHRAAPFATDADALDRPQHSQGDCAPDADLLVGWHEGDEKGCDAHKQKRRNERPLAADAVAVVAEYRGADRPARKADEIGAERCQSFGQRVLVGKIELAEDEAGRGAVDEEIVPLDGRADRRGDDGLTQLHTVVGRR